MPESDYMPKSAQLAKIMQLVENTPEAADYFLGRLEVIFGKSQMMDDDPKAVMFNRMVDFVNNVHLTKDRAASGVWKGGLPKEEFNTLQDSLASEATPRVQQAVSGDLKIDYAISKDSKIVRGFSTNGEMIRDPETIKDIDTLLNSWLADHRVITQNGTLYDANGDGQISWDERKQPVKADPERVSDLMEDMYQGLERYLAKKEIKASIERRVFPGEEQEVVVPMEIDNPDAMDIEPTQPSRTR